MAIEKALTFYQIIHVMLDEHFTVAAIIDEDHVDWGGKYFECFCMG